MKKRGLSGDENALWRRATRDVRPLPGRTPLADKTALAPPAGIKIGETTRRAAFPTRLERAPPVRRTGGEPPGSVFRSGDPKADRHARRGRRAIDARIDLHGMTGIAARVALAAFIERAVANQLRLLLVITGKGARPGGDAPFAEPRGVIRRGFLDWVEEPPLRDKIARVSKAALHDGGDGAFYVFLKAPRKAR